MGYVMPTDGVLADAVLRHVSAAELAAAHNEIMREDGKPPPPREDSNRDDPSDATP